MHDPFATPVILEGRHVRLEPLSTDHLDALCAAGLDADLWRWTTSHVATPDDMRRYVETALTEQRAGLSLPFATIEKAGGTVVGSTRFGNIAPLHRRVEIGWTWVAPAWQRTAINTESKKLLLTHAFDVLGCLRVEFKTDVLNTCSRAALSRLGAQEEGTLRKHIITAQGRVRDTVYFSIIADEWPAVRDTLDARIGLMGTRKPFHS